MKPIILAIASIALLAGPVAGQEGGAPEMQTKLNEHPRMEICLNGTWRWTPFRDGKPPRQKQYQFDVRVPGSCQRDDQTQEVSVWYRKVFPLPESLRDKKARWLLRFGKAGHYTRAYLNGKIIGENYGSFTAFEFDATKAIKWGGDNELVVHVHAADASHAQPGVVVDDLFRSLAYRAGGRYHRNWAQIIGDVTLHKRPAAHIAWNVAETSVRKKQLRLRGYVELPKGAADAELTIAASVVDPDSNETVLETTGPVKLTNSGLYRFDHTADWKDPVLWGFGPYGKPHLYFLRLELRDAKGKLLDAVVRRIGFREIWYEGRKLMLNGKELFIAAYAEPHSLDPVMSYHHPEGLYERNNIVRTIQVLRQSGFNGLHNHFDTYNTTMHDVADELGTLIVAGFFCHGPSWLTPRVGGDALWARTMTHDLKTWAEQIGGHPSVAMWSTLCGVPVHHGVKRAGESSNRIDEGHAIRDVDKTRPIIDHGVALTKAGLGAIRKKVKDELSKVEGPRFIKEVWGISGGNAGAARQAKGFVKFCADNDVSGYVAFGTTYPPMKFRARWLSDSGYGVRFHGKALKEYEGPINWCDRDKPLANESEVAKVLGAEYAKRWGGVGPVEVMAYPHLLSHHGKGAAYLAVESLSPARPAPRLVLLDAKSLGYINVRYPGKLRVHEIGAAGVRSQEIDAPRMKLLPKPGFDDTVHVRWDK